MITLEVIVPKNAPRFRDFRLRALQNSPISLSLTSTEKQHLVLGPIRSLLVTSAAAVLSQH